MNIQERKTSDESGNVLFLILIAVALFAALSYAVTQSTRSGSGSTEREQSILGSASLTQYPTALRTSIVRMILGGVDISSIVFNPPSAFGAIVTDRLVFHPDGGGAIFQSSPGDVMASGNAGTWYHNGHFEIPDVGRSGAGGNEVIAFLPGISAATCQRINEEFSIPANDGNCTYTTSGVPDANLADAEIEDNFEDGDTFSTSDETDLVCDGPGNAFDGQPSGCFYDSSLSQYVFFSVLLER